MKKPKKKAPELPRFVAPKRMTSVKFRTKRDKAMERHKLNREAQEYDD